MRTIVLITAGIAAFVLSVVPPGVRAQNSAVPVAINSCGPMLDNNQTQNVLGIPIASSSSGIQIQFTNTTPKTADLINFAVDSNGTSFIIRDVGTFSPDIEIKHKFRNGAGQAFILPQFIAPKLTCAVQSVRFTDGTVWRAGEAAVLPPPAGAASNPLSANPPSVQVDRNSETRLFMVSSTQKVAAFSERSTCDGIATVTLAATGEAAATYSVKPVSTGSCTAVVRDEAGNAVSVGITVR